MADLSQLSQEDLVSLQNRNFDSISEEGKRIIQAIQLPQPEAEKPEEEASAFKRFAYAYESADTDIGNLARYVKGKFLNCGPLNKSSKFGLRIVPVRRDAIVFAV